MLLHMISSKKINWQLPLALVLIFAFWGECKANAAPRGTDFFSINSSPARANKPAQKVPSATSNGPVPVVTWFEKFDSLAEKYQASDADRIILTRPLMQEAERVQQWTNVANKISKNYALLAKSLRNLPSPDKADVKEYRDLMADWYQDAASVYADLIRPRPPARTIEDLQEQLEVVKRRSESLAENITNLKAMDRTLRQEYNVHVAFQDDIIQQFVHSKQ